MSAFHVYRVTVCGSERYGDLCTNRLLIIYGFTADCMLCMVLSKVQAVPTVTKPLQSLQKLY